MINNVLFSIFFCSGGALFFIALELNSYFSKLCYREGFSKFRFFFHIFVNFFIAFLAVTLFNFSFGFM